VSHYAGTALANIRETDYHPQGIQLVRPKSGRASFSRREQIIVALLRTLADAIASLRGGEGYSRRESVLLVFGPEYRDGSYRQLEGVLYQMRTQVPWLYAPIRDRYLSCQRVQKVVKRSSAGVWYDVRFPCQTCNGKGLTCRTCNGQGRRPFGPQQQRYLQAETPGKQRETIGETERMVEYWSTKVREEQVAAGVAWLAQHFPGEPQLPRAFALVAA
jgi:hypothetical protein